MTKCDTHSAAGCHSKMASLVADITRVLNVALACGTTRGMRNLRWCVREYVTSRITWTDAPTEPGGYRVEGAQGSDLHGEVS